MRVTESETFETHSDRRASPPPLPRSLIKTNGLHAQRGGRIRLWLNVATAMYYFPPRHASSCSPFCPPQTPPPVDKSQDSRCPTQGSMRPFSCQAGKPESEVERKREAERNERTVRYLARAFQKRKWKKQESRGCCRTTNAMCGPRPHRQKPTPGRIPKAVRQTGDPSGPPASRTPESGKNGP